MSQILIDIPGDDMGRVVAGLAVAYSYDPVAHGPDIGAYVRHSIADQLSSMVVAVEKNNVVQTALVQAGDITPPVITYPGAVPWAPPTSPEPPAPDIPPIDTGSPPPSPEPTG